MEELRRLAANDKAWERASALAYPEQWEALGREGNLLWGQYYHFWVAYDLEWDAYRCDCPSRQRPCKHALGLRVLYQRYAPAVAEASAPDSLRAWQARQRPRAAQAAPSPPSPLSGEKLQQRLHNIDGGLQELRHWLRDAAQMGLADLAQAPATHWDRLRAHLVDAQAPGLANRLDALREAIAQPEQQGQALHQLGLLWLLAQAFARREQLAPDLQQELLNQAGVNQKKDLVLQGEPVDDQWIVLGRRVEIQERLDVQRTWLQGRNTRRLALLLDFSFGSQGFDMQLDPGQALSGSLCFYPGRYPLRALIKEREAPYPSPLTPTPQPLSQALRDYAQALGQNPWLERYPLCLSGLRPVPGQEQWIDEQGHSLPLHPAFQRHRELLALSGGHPLALMGEWDGYQLFPLAAAEGERWVKVG